MKTVIEKNILIAEWLNWDSMYCPESFFPPIDIWKELNVNSQVLNGEDLKFHSDSNWQWLCLEKIAKDNEMTISNLFQNQFWKINSKQDLFEAIVNHIKK